MRKIPLTGRDEMAWAILIYAYKIEKNNNNKN